MFTQSILYRRYATEANYGSVANEYANSDSLNCLSVFPLVFLQFHICLCELLALASVFSMISCVTRFSLKTLRSRYFPRLLEYQPVLITDQNDIIYRSYLKTPLKC